MGKPNEFRKARPTSSLTGEVMIKANDIEVRYENNTYLVRFVDDSIHILMPALGDYYADSILDAGARTDITNLALSSLVV